MSAVVIVVPLLTAVPWSAIGAAVVGMAASMGMSVAGEAQKETKGVWETIRENLKGKAVAPPASPNRAEAVVENTQLSAEDLSQMREITLKQGEIRIHLQRKKDGTCAVCAEGPGKTKSELQEIASRVSKKLVQQLIYNKVMTELKSRDFQIVDEHVEEGDRIRIRVSRWA
jgi:hypothetical protein